MIESKIRRIGPIEFPVFQPAQLHMLPIPLAGGFTLPDEFVHYTQTVFQMLLRSPIKHGTGFLTIDSKRVERGTTQRRAGPHVDGNYTLKNGWGHWPNNSSQYSWPNPDWPRSANGYANPKGGALIASTFAACKAWMGKFEAIPGDGGDCSHMDLPEPKSFLLFPNVLYLMNSTCIHESLPVAEAIDRQIVRITLPEVDVAV